jgi:hypothetical protein
LVALEFLKKCRQFVKTKTVDLLSAVVLVNCQLVGGADEGQAGFILVFAKAVLLHR